MFNVHAQVIQENGFLPGYTGAGGRGTAPEYEDEFYYGTFPADFKWGASSSSYQIEGGWNEGGKAIVPCDTLDNTFN